MALPAQLNATCVVIITSCRKPSWSVQPVLSSLLWALLHDSAALRGEGLTEWVLHSGLANLADPKRIDSPWTSFLYIGDKKGLWAKTGFHFCLLVLWSKSYSRVSNLLASLGCTGRRVVLGHTSNTLWHVVTKISCNVLSKFMILCWATFIASWSTCSPQATGWTPLQGKSNQLRAWFWVPFWYFLPEPLSAWLKPHFPWLSFPSITIMASTHGKCLGHSWERLEEQACQCDMCSHFQPQVSFYLVASLEDMPRIPLWVLNTGPYGARLHFTSWPQINVGSYSEIYT